LKNYQKRPVRFLEVYQHDDWRIKIYSISVRNEFVNQQNVDFAKAQLSNWLEKTKNYPLENYKITTLILHEGKEGCFAIINWWIDENMMQLHVYLANNENPSHFELYSDKGIITCVWEMAVLWFERNAWVKHVLMNATAPDFEKYLAEHLNEDV
jgi:hypothetical protein